MNETAIFTINTDLVHYYFFRMGRKPKPKEEKRDQREMEQESRARREADMGEAAYRDLINLQRRESRTKKKNHGSKADKDRERLMSRERGRKFRANEKARAAGEPIPYPKDGAVPDPPPAAPPAADAPQAPPADGAVPVPGGSGETPRRHVTPRRPRRTNNPLVRTFKIYKYNKNYAKCMQSFETQERALSMILKEITTE